MEMVCSGYFCRVVAPAHICPRECRIIGKKMKRIVTRGTELILRQHNSFRIGLKMLIMPRHCAGHLIQNNADMMKYNGKCQKCGVTY